MLDMNMRRGPTRLTRCGKKAICKMQFTKPYTDNHKPMDAGFRLSPPDSTGVDHTSGIYADAIMLRSANIARLLTETTTGLVITDRRGNGLFDSSGGESSQELSPASP